jgi:ribosomal protein L11 methyltransferase
MYRELVVIVARDVAEVLSDSLIELGALSVQAEDADADTTDEVAIFAEPGEPVADNAWRRTRLIALLDPQSKVRELADQDWVSLTQSQFEPIVIGPRLTIRPSWHQPVEIGQTEVILDPGLAFGTGSHPTTRMCLEWVEQCMPEGVSVIDYGCGSGILAIAAAKLGAGSVIAVDIDEQAVLSTQNNAANNQVVVLAHNTRQASPEAAQVVLANILANPLKVLAPALEALVLPGGTLILAGLLDRQVQEVAAAYTDIQMTVFRSREGWSCLVGMKPQ